jgi:glyoxylase-like metal-dependent hydrolase (beta-lactamase superfamily II)
VLTCPWHARDARTLVERMGASLYAPPPDEGDSNPLPAQVFTAGDRLPVGIEAYPGMEPNDLVLWIESRRALVAGDTLIDRRQGIEFPRDWASRGAVAERGVPPDEILASLRPLLELPVELVLPTHGQPGDRAALERALA